MSHSSYLFYVSVCACFCLLCVLVFFVFFFPGKGGIRVFCLSGGRGGFEKGRGGRLGALNPFFKKGGGGGKQGGNMFKGHMGLSGMN